MLGLRLRDVFETDKGTFIVNGVCFERGQRKGVTILPYCLKNDPHTSGKFLNDEQINENWNKIKFIKSEL